MMSDDNEPTWAVALNYTNASERWPPGYVAGAAKSMIAWKRGISYG